MKPAGCLALAALILVALPARAQAPARCGPAEPIWISNGLYSGTEATQKDEAWFRAYITGYVNGILVAPLLGAPVDCLAAAQKCVVGRNDMQMAAILRKYLSDHPEVWHERLNTITFRALVVPCIPDAS